jgi:hypothetical protein
MGASSSVYPEPRVVFDESKEEGKYDDEEYEKYIYSTYSIHNFCGHGYEEDEKNDCNSPVWIAINSIIKTILIIRTDFQNTHQPVLSEVMKKIMMNLDSIYNIKDEEFDHGELQSMDKPNLKIVKLLLTNYYGDQSLVVIKMDGEKQKIADLGKFMYDLLVFQIANNCVYVYIAS